MDGHILTNEQFISFKHQLRSEEREQSTLSSIPSLCHEIASAEFLSTLSETPASP